jgi:hypothetical protein
MFIPKAIHLEIASAIDRPGAALKALAANKKSYGQ